MTLSAGNLITEIVLVAVVIGLIYGLSDPKHHKLLLTIVILVLLAFIFAILFGKAVVTILL